MKQTSKPLVLAIIFTSLLFASSCKKINNTDHKNTGFTEKPLDTTTVNIPADNGNIGLTVDVRPIFKKGYIVSRVSVDIDGSLSAFSKTMDVDKLTNLAILKMKRDSLTDDQVKQFNKGVKLTIKAYDEAGNILANSTETNVVFNDSGDPFPVETDKPMIIPPVKLAAGVPYYIQKSPVVDGEANYVLTQHKTVFQGSSLALNPMMDKFGGEGTQSQMFYFESTGDGSNEYYIKSTQGYYLFYNDNKLYSSTSLPTNTPNAWKFKFISDGKGGVSIKPVNGNVLRMGTYTVQFPYTIYQTNGSLLYDNQGTSIKFRIIPANIEWNVTDLGMVSNDPILPPKKIEFAYSSILENCSGATLHESIGESKTRSTSYAAGSEESFQLTTSNSVTVGVTTTVTASGSFGGIGASASVELSAEYNYTQTMSQTQSRQFTETHGEEVQVQRQRDLDLLPYTAVKAYDAIESYDHIKIPFVQRLKVAGKMNDISLSGEEIVYQLMANQFGGVVVDVQPKYVIISVRGSATIDNLMKVTTRTDDIPNACSVP